MTQQMDYQHLSKVAVPLMIHKAVTGAVANTTLISLLCLPDSTAVYVQPAELAGIARNLLLFLNINIKKQ